MSGYRGVIRALRVRAEMKRYLVYDTMLLQVYDAGYSYGSAVFNAPRQVREAMDDRAKIIMEQARKHEISEDAVILTRERFDKIMAVVEAVEETLSIETPQKVLDALKALREETK